MIGIKKIMQKALTKNLAKEDVNFKVKEGEFHVSDVHECPRKIYLERIRPKPNTELDIRFCTIGKIIHEFLQSIFVGKDYQKEHKMIKSFGDIALKGSADLVNKDVIIEFKTVSRPIMTKPRDNHVKQLNLYLGILGKKKGVLVYINRNDLDVQEYDLKFNKKLFEDSLSLFRYVNSCLKSKTLPKMIPSPNCYYCKYYSDCFLK